MHSRRRHIDGFEQMESEVSYLHDLIGCKDLPS
jgi:hypothetical protein